MIELKDELYAAPEYEWRSVPITANRHKWWLKMYRFEGRGNYYLCFESPRTRTYSFRVKRGADGHVRVTDADVALANGKTIASYWSLWDDNEKLDAVIRLTPKHILDRLQLLLDAI